MKTWRELALKNHIALTRVSNSLKKNFMPELKAERMIIEIDTLLKGNISIIKKLNEEEINKGK